MLFFGKKKRSSEPGVLYATQTGRLMPITEMPDEIFADKTLGDGVCILPEEGCVYAPCDGTVSSVAHTGHAMAITAADGAELIVHIGIDTVELNGAGFQLKVQAGEQIKKGDLLCCVDLDLIRQAGHPLHTAIVMANYHEFSLDFPGKEPVTACESIVLRYGRK